MSHPLTEMVIANGGEYYNKGKRCLWIELHDGTTRKFIVSSQEEAEAKNLATHLDITRTLAMTTDED